MAVSSSNINANVMTLSFDVNGNIGNNTLRVRIEQWNGETAMNDIVENIDVSSDVVRKSITFYIGYGATHVKPHFEIVSGGTNNGTVYIDNVLLETGALNNDYVDGWFKYSDDGAAPKLSKIDIFDSGEYSLKIQSCNDTNTKIGIQSERLPISALEDIYVRASVMPGQAISDEVLSIDYEWFDIDGVKIGSTETSSGTIQDDLWTANWFMKRAPAGAEIVQITLYVESASAITAGTFYMLDNVYISSIEGEAAQYLVVEQVSEISNANVGAIGVGYYLADFHNEENNDYVILSIDQEDSGVQVVKKYDSTAAAHKIAMRHIYLDNGASNTYDEDILTLSGGDFGAWHYILLAWEGDTFKVAVSDSEWAIEEFDTGLRDSFFINGDVEATIGAGISGADSLGTAIKNVKIYDETPALEDFVTNQTSTGNYYLPLADDINIKMYGECNFIYDFTGLYEAVDDVKIEWTPLSPNVEIVGGGSTESQVELNSGSEPAPLKGGLSPSEYAQKYYLKIKLNTDNLIYSPAIVEGLSFSFLDKAMFKTATANNKIIPAGSFTIATQSQPIISRFARNGVSFTAQDSKNMIINGGFAYDVKYWAASNDSGAASLAYSTDEYVSGGSSMEVTSQSADFKIVNASSMGKNLIQIVSSDTGDFGLSNLNDGDYSIEQSPGVKPASNSMSVKITQLGTDNIEYGMSLLAAVDVKPSSSYTASCKVLNSSGNTIRIYVKEYDASNNVVAETYTESIPSSDEWTIISHDITSDTDAAKASVYVYGSSWDVNDYFYVADFQLEAGGVQTDYLLTPFDEEHTHNQIQVESETDYVVSLSSALGTSSSCSLQLEISWYDYNGTLISSDTSTTTALTEEWQALYHSASSPATAVYATIGILGSNMEVSKTIYIDHIQLEEGVEPTAFEDNCPSQMTLDIEQDYLLPAFSEDGTYVASTDQQKIGTLEQWVYLPSVPVDNLLEVRGDNLLPATMIGDLVDLEYVTSGGKNWTSATSSASSLGIALPVSLGSLSAGEYYIGSVECYNPGESAISISISWCSQGTQSYTIGPKQSKTIYTSAATATYSIVNRFMTIVPEAESIVLLRRPRVEHSESGGTPAQRVFTILENAIDSDNISGVYIDVDGISSSNMDKVYVNGVEVTTDDAQIQGKEWNHIVAMPSTFSSYTNYIKNPAISTTAEWSTHANASLAEEVIDTPAFRNALSLAWASDSNPTISASQIDFAAVTDIDAISPGAYNLSFYMKSETSRAVNALINWYDESDVLIGTSRFTGGVTDTSWSRYSFPCRVHGAIDHATVYIGVDTESDNVNGEEHFIAAPMLVNNFYMIPYFDGTDENVSWAGTANASISSQSLFWPYANNNIFGGWRWNASFNGKNQMNASYSNIFLYESVLSSSQVLTNYQANFSRGTAISVQDSLLPLSSSVTPGSSHYIHDGQPIIISAPWQIYHGTA